MNFTGTIRDRHEQAHGEIAEIDFGAYIGGETRPASDGETFEPTDPAVDEPITAVARCGGAEVDDAVAAADAAFDDGWGAMDAGERAALLRAWVDEMRENVDELALLQTL